MGENLRGLREKLKHKNRTLLSQFGSQNDVHMNGRKVFDKIIQKFLKLIIQCQSRLKF